MNQRLHTGEFAEEYNLDIRKAVIAIHTYHGTDFIKADDWGLQIFDSVGDRMLQMSDYALAITNDPLGPPPYNYIFIKNRAWGRSNPLFHSEFFRRFVDACPTVHFSVGETESNTHAMYLHIENETDLVYFRLMTAD